MIYWDDIFSPLSLVQSKKNCPRVARWRGSREKVKAPRALPGLYNWANSWAPLCCGPHRGRLSADWSFFDIWQLAFGSSSSIEFSRICWSVFTGVCSDRRDERELVTARSDAGANTYCSKKIRRHLERCRRYHLQITSVQWHIFACVRPRGICFKWNNIHHLSHLNQKTHANSVRFYFIICSAYFCFVRVWTVHIRFRSIRWSAFRLNAPIYSAQINSDFSFIIKKQQYSFICFGC